VIQEGLPQLSDWIFKYFCITNKRNRKGNLKTEWLTENEGKTPLTSHVSRGRSLSGGPPWIGRQIGTFGLVLALNLIKDYLKRFGLLHSDVIGHGSACSHKQ
jgi:hypothetical protein